MSDPPVLGRGARPDDGEVAPEDAEPRRPRRAPGAPFDVLAVAALVLSLLGVHVVGIVLGHLAVARVRENGRRGRGLAIAALLIGYAGLALALAWWVFYFAVLAPVVTLPG